MSNLIPGNQKHLTLDNRVFIEKCLDQDMSMKDIAKPLLYVMDFSNSHPHPLILLYISFYYLHRISLHARCGLKLSFISHLNNTFFIIVWD